MILSSESHDTAVTERAGMFSVYCGCGWQALDLDALQALEAEQVHLAAVGAYRRASVA